MFNFIDVLDYRHIYDFSVLLLLLLVLAGLGKSSSADGARTVSLIGFVYFVLLTLFIATRPVSYYFGDMGTYHKQFVALMYGYDDFTYELLFMWLMKVVAIFFESQVFFFLCALLYFIPIYISYKKSLGAEWVVAFLASLLFIDFYGYAVNGIRHGVAASFFLLAVVYHEKFRLAFAAVAIGFHSSFILPVLAILGAKYINYKVSLRIWFGCLVLSIFYSGFSDLLSNLGVFEDRWDIYLNADEEFISQFSRVGFRWDFVLYSMIPIAISFWAIRLKGFKDVWYENLSVIYLLSNAFWLLVNRMPSSNRIAFLSWCLMGLMSVYPLVKGKDIKSRNGVLVGVLLLYAAILFIYKS